MFYKGKKMIKKLKLSIFTLCFTIIIFNNFYGYYFSQKMIVCKPVIDLRSQPTANTANLPALENKFQITQLLLGEHIIAHEEFIDSYQTKWLRINTLQQEYFYEPLMWHGFPGWIKADGAIQIDTFPTYNLVIKSYLANIFDNQNNKIFTLSIGTRLFGQRYNESIWKITLPDKKTAFIKDSDIYFITPTIQESTEDLRKSIIKTTFKFLNNWYSWGGRSAQNNDFGISSVDCSALINLSFLSHGLQIPRMSHEQFLRSEPIENCKKLQPGDLIFFSPIKEEAKRMNHVMMYLGNNLLIEATGADFMVTRITSFDKRMGQPCNGLLNNGDIVKDADDDYYVFFGSFF